MDERYNRQALIPDWNQDSLASAKVLILGVGATGSYLATNLALAGIGNIVLVDFDTIEKSNLNRQLLFNDSDIGKNKALVAQERLQVLNPGINIVAFPDAMEKLSKDIISGTTVIACCLDTFLGRRWANSLAIREKVPMVTSGMYAFLGNVQTIIPYDTPCFECQPLISQEKLSQACTPLGEAREDLKEEKEQPSLPSVSSLSSIISGLMTQEILKLILKVGKLIDNYLFFDGLTNSFTTVPLKRNPNCPICGENYKLEQSEVIIFKGETIANVLSRVALAFGMADPEAMYKGRYLDKDHKFEGDESGKIFVRDERLATPIALTIKFSDPK